ncbi:MAG: hypothetical protein KA780_01640 [Prolixibacteraceae bacterium]|nr:hypothetical protein [Prolixibacteraceae bacterium]HOY50961.1 hypothetical protein [Prolixibacteraceae bacterium]
MYINQKIPAPTAKKKRYLSVALTFFFKLSLLNIQKIPRKKAAKVVIFTVWADAGGIEPASDANLAKPLIWRAALLSVAGLKRGKCQWIMFGQKRIWVNIF